MNRDASGSKQDVDWSKREDAGGKKPLVVSKSSMFNMPKNTRTPNVFTTAPRPGGYLQTIVSPNSYNQASINNTLGIHYTPPRLSDRSKLLEGFQNLDQWIEGNKSGNPCDENKSISRSRSTSPDHKDGTGPDVSAQQVEAWPTGRKSLTENCNNVMAIAMSTIMALAANPSTKPPDHHLTWTVNFLNSIKDDENKSPINIQGIKELLRPFLDDVPQSFLLPSEPVDQSLELHKTQPLPTKRPIQKAKQPSPTPSQQSAVATGAIPKNKGAAPTAKKSSFEAGSRSPPRKSSWK